MTVHDWLRRRHWLYRWVPVAAWMGLIFYLSAQPDLPHPQTGWVSLLFSSGAHAFMFGALAALWARGLAERPRASILAFCAAVVYALSDEFHQAFVPGRTPDPVDLACDAVGAVAGLWLWVLARRHSRT
jgi:VanZ family protein